MTSRMLVFRCTRGRFSVIGIEPDLIWRCKNKIAEINNKMSDDIRIIFQEYRLALKKNNAKREI